MDHVNGTVRDLISFRRRVNVALSLAMELANRFSGISTEKRRLARASTLFLFIALREKTILEYLVCIDSLLRHKHVPIGDYFLKHFPNRKLYHFDDY